MRLVLEAGYVLLWSKDQEQPVTQSNSLRGASLMVASMASFSINDACVKAISNQMPFFQSMFLRGVGTVVLLAILTLALGQFRIAFGQANWRWVSIRSAAEAASAFCFLTALFNMPLSNASAILQVLPLSVTLAAAVFLGEPIGWRRISAIIVGFVGVMLIMRPGTDGFTVYSLFALAAVGFVTLRDLSARKLGPQVPSMMAALVAAVGVTALFGAGALVTDWVPVTVASGGLLAMAVVFILGGYVFSVMVMRTGNIGTIAPFRYTSLLFSMGLGMAVFGERPDALTWIGAGIILAAGMFTLIREGRLRRGD